MANIKLNQLAMLVAVVDSGSFSAASVELDCTQSRISHAIAELEKRVGATLLVRSRNGCKPTRAGVQVLAKARQLLKIAESIPTGLDASAEAAGHVRLASIRSAATYLLPAAVEALAERHPHVSIEIFDGCPDYQDVVRMVERDEADVGITRFVDTPGLVCIPYVSDPYVAVVPASIMVSSPAEWQELAHLPLLQLRQSGSTWVFAQLRNEGLRQDTSTWWTNESSILTRVAQGLGFTVLPRLTTLPDLPGTKLARLQGRPMRQLVVLGKPPVLESAAVRSVTAVLRDRRVIAASEAWRLGALA